MARKEEMRKRVLPRKRIVTEGGTYQVIDGHECSIWMVYYNGVCMDGEKVTHKVKNALFQGEEDGIVDVKDLHIQVNIIHMLDQKLS